MQNFILIGYGNLAHSMMSGFSQDSKFKNQTFYIYGRDPNKAENFAKCFANAVTIPSLEAITPQTNIILCIKPKGLKNLHLDLPFDLLYSVMAGVKIATLKEHFPKAKAFARSMPNVGASVQHSSTSLYTQGEKCFQDLAIALSEAFGKAVLFDHEDLIDASIATNGSAPAFLSLVTEALIEAGLREGIPYKQSQDLVNATFEGFAKLLKTYSPQEIKSLVTSPGGTTAEGLAYLELQGFKGILQEAAHKSVLRAKGKI